MERLEALISAWGKGIVLAHKICLLNEGGMMKVCVVEYGYLDIKDGKLCSFKDYLRSKKGGLKLKLKLFKLLVQAIG